LQWKKECIEQPTTAEPMWVVNKLKVQIERKKHRNKKETKFNPKKETRQTQSERRF
jgi:hypothetical protein